MSLKLLPPRSYRGNKYWLIYGDLDGKKIERSTRTSDRGEAQEILEEYLEKRKKLKKLKAYMSFAEAAQRFIDFRQPPEYEQVRIRRICALIGDKPVMDIVQDDIYRIAKVVYKSETKNSTKNRYIITPASMVLKYAVDNEWRHPIKIKRYPEPAPKPRYISEEKTSLLLNAVKSDDDKYLFLLWLFRQGDRIEDAVKIKYEDVDLKKKTVLRYISKSDRYAELPLDDEICEILKKRDLHEGKVFPWQTRYGPGQWIQKLSKSLKIKFTAHMARHTLGKELNDGGAGMKTIMQILGQTDPRSGARYQNTGLDEMRAAKNRARRGKSRGDEE